MNEPLIVPDWYGRLNVDDRKPVTSQTPADRLWLIIHDDWFDEERRRSGDSKLFEEVLSFRQHVQEQFPHALTFEFLPFIFVQCSQADLQQLSHLPRFRFALPQAVDVVDYLPILRGINALRSETGHQLYEWSNFVADGGTLPDDKFVGGQMPEQEYPTPLNNEYILADSSIPRATPPAWMPVINLSIGPMIADSPANPVALALTAAVTTHLVVVSAGNGGASSDSPGLNSWAPNGGLVVGASEDIAGTRLAGYSSRGKPDNKSNHPDVIAWGVSTLGQEHGTSYAAPRVSKLGCLASAALFQVLRVMEEMNDRHVGLPLVGWGLIDTGNEIAGLPARNDMNVLPFTGIREQVLRDVFHSAIKAGHKFRFYMNGSLLRSMILRSARPMQGYSHNEVGAGFVDEGIFLDWLANLRVGEFLLPFGPADKLSSSLLSMPLFEREALSELAEVVRQSRPIWFFDYEHQSFGVSETRSKGKQLLPVSGRGYSHATHVAFS